MFYPIFFAKSFLKNVFFLFCFLSCLMYLLSVLHSCWSHNLLFVEINDMRKNIFRHLSSTKFSAPKTIVIFRPWMHIAKAKKPQSFSYWRMQNSLPCSLIKVPKHLQANSDPTGLLKMPINGCHMTTKYGCYYI